MLQGPALLDNHHIIIIAVVVIIFICLVFLTKSSIFVIVFVARKSYRLYSIVVYRLFFVPFPSFFLVLIFLHLVFLLSSFFPHSDFVSSFRHPFSFSNFPEGAQVLHDHISSGHQSCMNIS